MPVHTLPAAEALTRLSSFDTIIDARTEDEYALDHLPGAVNWPSLHDEERVRVGTLYRQVNPFEARKLGAALVARNIAAHIERILENLLVAERLLVQTDGLFHHFEHANSLDLR